MELRILLNAGHGNDTPGKRWSFNGKTFYEWESNRETIKLLAPMLDAEGIPYHIITSEEYDVPLSERAKRVNALCAKYGKENCLLFSIHSNASVNHNVGGISIYTSRGNTMSDEYAEIVWNEGKHFNPNARMLADMSDGDHDFEAGFYMVKKTACPAVLVESYFYDYEPDFNVLMSRKGKEQIALWYLESIKKCIELYNQKHQNK